jgi:excisionase family DNA binding protein
MLMKTKTYTTSQLAEALGVHPDTIRRWEAKGRIPEARRFRKEDGPRIFTEEDLRAAKKYRDRVIEPARSRQRSLNFQRT